MQVSRPPETRFRSSSEPSRTSMRSTSVTIVTTFLGRDTRTLCSWDGRPSDCVSFGFVALLGIPDLLDAVAAFPRRSSGSVGVIDCSSLDGAAVAMIDADFGLGGPRVRLDAGEPHRFSAATAGRTTERNVLRRRMRLPSFAHEVAPSSCRRELDPSLRPPTPGTRPLSVMRAILRPFFSVSDSYCGLGIVAGARER